MSHRARASLRLALSGDTGSRGTPAERAHRGAAVMDTVRPGWAPEVSPDRLDMSCAFDCVWAQIYGGYGKGIDATGIDDRAWHGFLAYEYDDPDAEQAEYGELTAAWRQEIAARFAPPVAGDGQ